MPPTDLERQLDVPLGTPTRPLWRVAIPLLVLLVWHACGIAAAGLHFVAVATLAT